MKWPFLKQARAFALDFPRWHAYHVAQRVVSRVRCIESESTRALQARIETLRAQLAKHPEPMSVLEDVFAIVCCAAHRELGLMPYPEQIMGAVGLAGGHFIEMHTGEGKTLAAVLPACLLACAGKGVHVVTVNDYLARRDAEWMQPIYSFLGLHVGVVTGDENEEERRKAYASDVTYVTNSELVFDFLRDNLAMHREEIVTRPLYAAIVDEVDFLLLDEAKTPLIISEPMREEAEYAKKAAKAVSVLVADEDFQVDYKNRQVLLTDAAYDKIEAALGEVIFADASQFMWHLAVHNALLAAYIYERDVDYIVSDRRIVLVDEFTGRVTPDKRLADGLHQALEAKERVVIRPDDQTLARISYQNYFRRYPVLAGMSGTTWSEREEFIKIYKRKVVRVPPHRTKQRKDFVEEVYVTSRARDAAVLEEVKALRAAGRPVLLGTVSVKASERFSRLFKQGGIPHQVLNAKRHEKEAHIIAQAGREGVVTIATNMAGRGTDILLGGNPDAHLYHEQSADQAQAGEERNVRAACEAERARVREAGGLAVIGTELHDAERIDAQLRGRAGRQGDPGSSQFYISFEDSVFRKFGKKVIARLKQACSEKGDRGPIADPIVRTELQVLRKKVEIEDRAIRLELFGYDQVIEGQFKEIEQWRRRALLFDTEAGESLWDHLLDRYEACVRDRYGAVPGSDNEAFVSDGQLLLGESSDSNGESVDIRNLVSKLDARAKKRRSRMGAHAFEEFVQQGYLSVIDALWTDHLNILEWLEEGIGLRGYGELDPLVEFRREAGMLFNGFSHQVLLNTMVVLVGRGVRAKTGRPTERSPSARKRRRMKKQ